MPAIVMPELKKPIHAPRLPKLAYSGPPPRPFDRGVAFDYNHVTDQFYAEEIIPNVLPTLPFEGHHTRWYVKSGDLLKNVVGLSIERSISDKPAFFGLEDWPLSKLGHVAVMMPYASGFEEVYQTIKESCRLSGREPIRVKEVLSRQPIIADVFTTIVQSSVVICDITGLNANVLYEAGIGHARNVPVILITQDTGDPPFNLSQQQVVHYLPNEQGLGVLLKELVRQIEFFAS